MAATRVQELMLREKALSFLVNPNLKLLMFGGKGGVGKTTCSASTAIYLARKYPERKVLVMSTDPAHSLADSLDCPLGSVARPVEGIDNLWGLEVDAQELMDDYKEKHHRAMRKIAQRGTILDDRDINMILDLTLPGLDEMMAVILIADILRERVFDLIIMDTAPTGHTLRLLALPGKMRRWGKVLDLMQEKHRYISKVYTGWYRRDEADAFTKMVADDVGRVDKLLKDARMTEFVPVMIPEPMSTYETERLVAVLEELKIRINNIIINRVAEEEDCPFCRSRQRDQEEHLPEIEEKFGHCHLVKMPLFPHEIRGIEGLTEYARVLADGDYRYHPTQVVESPVEATPTTGKLSDLLETDFQFLIFGGKGGVGKTSSAAATALQLARHHRDRKMLIFSTDPAHSLADSFACPIGDKLTSIERNLDAIEIDAPKLWDDFAELYKTEVNNAFDRLMEQRGTRTSGGEILFDRETMVEMIDASPLGIDEIMALDKIVDFMNEGTYDLVILDTAPTGHLLRFLELPELVRGWLKTLFRMQIKYKVVMPLSYTENLNGRLIKLSRGTRRVVETLLNPQTTEFVAVTIPEAMGLLEMEDLLAALKKLGIPCRHIIVNKIIPPSRCSFCSAKREEQQRYVRQVGETKGAEYLITEVELFPHQIRGLDDLREYAARIF